MINILPQIMSGVRNENYIKAFGNNLRKIRVSKGMTCEDLEAATEIDAKQISRLERGERSPTISTIYVLAQGLSIPPYKLLQFEFNE